ncbi:MAG: DNA replication/repair protein RecF [Bacteroidota bacterium]
MFLRKLSIVNYKNCLSADLSFSSKINCFVGNNGQGKTNILDAIYYLSYCKSNFNPIDSENINNEEAFFVIKGVFDLNEKDASVFCGVKRNQKKQFKFNDKEYSRLADHIGLLPIVMVSPYDNELIIGGSELRRNFVSSIISQYDKVYLDRLIDYNKLLKQRNIMLKQMSKEGKRDRDVISIWDEQMAVIGAEIFEKRKQFIEIFNPLFEEFYQYITLGKEKTKLIYISQLEDASLLDLFEKSFEKDLILQYTSKGIHKDDLDFLLDENQIKRFGSQGQQKSYILALKLAQFEFLRRLKSFKPIILFDDIFDKLDNERVTQLLKLVSENNFGQIFITDTSNERFEHILDEIDSLYKIFNITNGEVTEINSKE